MSVTFNQREREGIVLRDGTFTFRYMRVVDRLLHVRGSTGVYVNLGILESDGRISTRPELER